MNVNEFVTTMGFSHRPQDGISVGFAIVNDVAYMSIGFVREGDYFSRKLARKILAQRIMSKLNDGDKQIRFVLSKTAHNVDVRSLVREFRKLFKPDPTCNDETFCISRNIPEMQVVARIPLSRDQVFSKVSQMFIQAVNTVEKQTA